tara:strand:- start:827 stop:1393 length:567 start_codon:yes stop_codon:yes gene_type:complete
VFSIFTNYSFAKDLSGNALDCYAQNIFKRMPDGYFPKGFKTKKHYHATIQFLTKNKIKFALAIFDDKSIENETKKIIADQEFHFLLQESTLNYKVTKSKIIIKGTDKVKDMHDPRRWWKRLVSEKKGEIWIWRENLNIFDPILTYRAKEPRMRCELVAFENKELFKKYKEFGKTLNRLLSNNNKKNKL